MTKVNSESIIKALQENHGLIEMAAMALQVNRNTIYKRIKSDELVKQAFLEARESELDKVESKLLEAANKGEPWAIQFFLKNIGKGRGYGDTQNINITRDLFEDTQYRFDLLDGSELDILASLLEKAKPKLIEGNFKE